MVRIPSQVNSDNVKYTESHIETTYDYQTTNVTQDATGYVVEPVTTRYQVRSQTL